MFHGSVTQYEPIDGYNYKSLIISKTNALVLVLLVNYN